MCLKCDGTRTETRFRLSAKRTSPFKSAGASVQSTTGSRNVRISGSNAGYTMFRGSVKSTGYPLHSPVSPSLPLTCVTVCHHVSAGLYPLYSRLGRSPKPVWRSAEKSRLPQRDSIPGRSNPKPVTIPTKLAVRTSNRHTAEWRYRSTHL